MRIAYLMSSDLRDDHPDAREDRYEHALQFDAIHKEGARHGLSVEEVIWDDPAINWTDFDAALIGTTWDYTKKREAFLATLASIDQQTRLFNPLGLVRWNIDKVYLAKLAEAGVPSITTLWADAARHDVIASAFDTLGCDDIVIKPRVGAGAWRQARLKRGEAMPSVENLPPAACMIQPFLPLVAKYGEVSMLFYEGVFHHALRKIPQSGDYRVQSLYGAHEVPHTPDTGEHEAAKAAISALPELPLYARIDLVRGDEQSPVVMEVEMIEPYHYPEQGPDFAAPLVAGMRRRLR